MIIRKFKGLLLENMSVKYLLGLYVSRHIDNTDMARTTIWAAYGPSICNGRGGG